MAGLEKTPKYKIGDKVKLAVGGPAMAIKQTHPGYDNSDKFYGTYRCQWFAGKKLEWGDFPEDNLILIEEESQSDDS